jgi:ABC-type nitrate/sulfonate/bicarbonate transport system substrate-binding protein
MKEPAARSTGRKGRAYGSGFGLAAVCSVLAMGIAACSSSGSGTTAASGSLSSQTVTVMVNTPNNLAYMAFEAAKQLGTFPASGPKVNVLVGTDPTAVQALAANSVDIAVVSGAEASTALGKGISAKMIAANSYKQIQSMIVSKSYAAKYGDQFKDLGHANFGISGTTGVGALIDSTIASHYGFTAGSSGYSSVVLTAGEPALVAAFKSGTINAFAWDPAVLLPLQEAGFGTVIGPVAPYLANAVGGAVLASSKALSSEPAAIKSVLTSYFAEVRKLMADPTLAESVMTKDWGESETSAKADLAVLNSSYYSPDGSATSTQLQNMINQAKFSNPSLPSIDLKSIYQPWTSLG